MPTVGAQAGASPRRDRRWGSVAASAAATLAVVVGLSSLAGATTTYTAPYAHTLTSITKYHYVASQCRASARTHDNQWNSSIGRLRAVVSASAKSCRLPVYGIGNSWVSASETISIFIPVSVSSGGRNVSVTTTYAVGIVGATGANATCPLPMQIAGRMTSGGCASSVDAGAYWNEFVCDATNRSCTTGLSGAAGGVSSSMSVSDYTWCSGNGSCGWFNSSSGCSSYHAGSRCLPWGVKATGHRTLWVNTGDDCVSTDYSGNCDWWSNWTLNGSHRFFVLLEYTLYADAQTYGFPGQTVSAELNDATGGNVGLTVSSIVVT